MKVEMRLYASLQDYLPDKGEGEVRIVELPEGSRIQDLLDKFNIPVDAIKVMFRNGIHSRADDILKDGDRVGAFPPVAGG